MNQDELAKVRALLPVPIGSGQSIKASGDAAARRRKVVKMFPELLAHADAQATEISDLKAVIGSMADEIDSLSSLPDKVDRLTGQIEVLKEMLIEAEARRIYPFTMPMWANLPEENHTWRTFGGMEERHGKAFYRQEARKQLAEDPDLKAAGGDVR